MLIRTVVQAIVGVIRKKHLIILALTFLFSSSAFADHFTLTSGSFSLTSSIAGHGAFFDLAFDGGTIKGGAVDDGEGWGWGCDLGGIGPTSCAGQVTLSLHGISYPFMAGSVFGPDGDPLNLTPGLGEFSKTVFGAFGVSGMFCVSPGKNCVQVAADGPAVATVHYIEFGPGHYEPRSAQGVIIPEPSTVLLLLTGVGCTILRWKRPGLPK